MIILCKDCNAVRSVIASPCPRCGSIMTITETAVAMMDIPTRQFHDNVLHEVREARHHFPTTRGLVLAAGNISRALYHASNPGDFRMACVKLAAIAARLAIEGDIDYPHSLPTKDDPLLELERELQKRVPMKDTATGQEIA